MHPSRTVARAVRASVVASILPVLTLVGFSTCGGDSPAGSSTAASSEARRPFPQNVRYAHGFKPGSISASDAEAAYQVFRQRYVKSDCGSGLLRVEFTEPMGTTVSEGMGYGMLLAAYHGDKTDFDQLYAFVKKNWNANQVMGWKVTCAGPVRDVGGENAATDGDLDIAFALVVAANQWGGSYWDEARGYVGRLKKHMWEFCPETNRWCQRAGDTHGGCNYSNSSYWMPGYYRVFRELTGDGFWDQATSGAYAQMLANRNATTGFVANEVDQYGNVANGKDYVDYNGARTPWRIGTDYIWSGAAEAKDVADKMTEWAASRGIHTLVDGYMTDGRVPDGHNWTRSNPWNGAWAVGAMAHSQARTDEFSNWFEGGNADDGYYGTALRALYMFTLSGNFWRPSGR